MSYDIKLMHLKTEETALMKHPQYILGSNVPAKMIDGVLVPIMQTEASLSVTYNYSKYYNDAAKGDVRFCIMTKIMEYGACLVRRHMNRFLC